MSCWTCFMFASVSSCLEWRCAYPLLEEAGLEAWAVDVLGWGFSDLGSFTCLFLFVIWSELDFFFLSYLSFATNASLFIHPFNHSLLVLERRPPCSAASKRHHLYQVSIIYCGFLLLYCVLLYRERRFCLKVMPLVKNAVCLFLYSMWCNNIFGWQLS